MRIVDVRDIVAPIRSNIANAYIDFSQMTASVVAIETDLRIEGKPVIGYGFNSNGRPALGGIDQALGLAARFRGPDRSRQVLVGRDGKRKAGRARRALCV